MHLYHDLSPFKGFQLMRLANLSWNSKDDGTEFLESKESLAQLPPASPKSNRL